MEQLKNISTKAVNTITSLIVIYSISFVLLMIFLNLTNKGLLIRGNAIELGKLDLVSSVQEFKN